jgi:D-alanyl-lipoteichoic acid acyltransferase DltB (MBOAT superfamily)
MTRGEPASENGAMLFPTFDFLLFAVPVLVGFWALSEKPTARIFFLIGASYFFYMAGPKTDPPPAPWYYVGLLLFSTVLDFVAGRSIHALEGDSESDDDRVKKRATRTRNLWMIASLVGNLGLLAYFKYVNFFIQAFSDVVGLFGLSVHAWHLDVILPLGISFYTFQSLSYTLDVWRGRLKPEPSFARFALFVVFFPQLVAGPIVRASQFLPQLRAGPKFSREDFETGAFRIIKGLIKKVVLGDWIAVHLTDIVFDSPETYTSAELMVALYAYTLQIYADFSGYSDIAIGAGRMLGFKIPENFDRPYQSRDIAEYWRRWHMTLSTWLRDYLFFSLLARLGARGGYIAVWLTMFLVGMWHGASWNFVIYANLHAGAVVFNRWNRIRKRDKPWLRRVATWTIGLAIGYAVATAIGYGVLGLELDHAILLGGFLAGAFAFVSWFPTTGGKLNTAVHVLLTLHLVLLSRIFFRSPDLETARKFVAGLIDFDLYGIRPGFVSPWIWAALVFGLLYHFTPKEWVNVHALKWFRKTPGIVLGLGFVGLAYGLMKLLEGAPRAFIYFQF